MKRPAAVVLFADRVPSQEHSQASGRRLIPFLVGHLVAIGTQPGNIFHSGPPNRTSLKKATPVKARMAAADFDQALDVRNQFAIFLFELPIDPAQFVVLTVGVIVAGLSTAEFVTRQDHWNTL